MSLDESWNEFFTQEIPKDYFRKVSSYVQTQRNEGKKIYPPEGMVFEAFKLTTFDDIKVVIVGNEPYSSKGQDHGVAFSVRKGIKVPPPLANVYKELNNTLGVPISKNGDLTPWAEKGILLLNSTLTVEDGTPESHKGKGWETFTDNCIKYISDNKKDPIVFCLWGSAAQGKSFNISMRHLVLKASHPGPLTVNQGFAGCGHFTNINRATKIWE